MSDISLPATAGTPKPPPGHMPAEAQEDISEAAPEGAAAAQPRRTATVLVKRRIDDNLSGSGVVLTGLLGLLAEAGYAVRLVLAPEAAFGSQPVLKPAPAYLETSEDIIWPGTVRVGPWYVALAPKVWRRFFRRIGRQVRWLLANRDASFRPSIPSDLSVVPAADEAGPMIDAVNAAPPDLVVAEYSSLAPLLRKCVGARRAVLLHDLFSNRGLTFDRINRPRDHICVTLDDEISQMDAADLVLHVSQVELGIVRERAPRARHLWLPPVLSETPGKTQGRPQLVYIGTRHGGSIDAADVLVHDLWPRIHARCPEAELLLVGEVSTLFSADETPGLRIVGRIPDLASVCSSETIGIANDRAGSGICIKITTYLSLGMPVVAHDRLIPPFGDTLDGLLATAGDEDGLVEEIVALLDDPQRRQAMSARALAELPDRLSNDEVVRHLRDSDYGGEYDAEYGAARGPVPA